MRIRRNARKQPDRVIFFGPLAATGMDTHQPDHYRLLGVSAKADALELKNSYRKLSRVFHPDRQRGSVRAADCFKLIAAAYAELSDPARRLHYDRVLLLKDPLRLVEDPRAARALDVVDSVVARLRKKLPELPGAERGRDLRVEHPVPFAIAMLGGDVRVQAAYQTVCLPCSGQGTSEPERNPICHVCVGHGSLRIGLRRSEMGCGFCLGRGTVLLAPCASCAGKGLVGASHEVTVTLPPRCHDGLHVRVRQAGERAASGGPSGDLVVVVRVQPHPLLQAARDDLVCQVPLTWTQAAVGARVPVPTLEGPEWLTIPPETPAGREFRIANRGLPLPTPVGARILQPTVRAGQTPQSRGALRLVVVIDAPQGLTATQLEAVRALGAMLGFDRFPRAQAYLRAVEGLEPPSEPPA